jgi:transcriptional regulator with XRE-family HTH domain
VFTEAFGRALRESRKRLGLSQERLAHDTGVHPTYISQIERGLKSPSLEVVAALSQALGRRPHTLIKAAEAVVAD